MKQLFTFLLFSLSLCIFAQEPVGYYNAAVGKTSAVLKTSLSGIVESHTQRTYSNLWTDMQTTDKKADGKVWDMYSNCSFTFGTNQDSGSGGSAECQFYNREHSFPKSWMGIASGQENSVPMGTDLFHLYPTDKWVNNQRSNYPFGETATPSATYGNGSKLGNSTFAGYSGIVYEPADEYKGDFARTYFYMVTAYDDKVAGWVSDQLAGNQYPALSSWSVTLLLKWSNQDPVSTKELNRNNAIYGIQKNRNPFIDHPELAEYIWGIHKGEVWTLTTAIDDVKIKFSISPNPVQDVLTIQSDDQDLHYTIYNLSGQVVMNNSLVGTHSISVNTLENGMYLLQLKSGNRKSIQKFIVNK
jgi:endonuclease I